MSRFDPEVTQQVGNALDKATDVSTRWQLLLTALDHGARDGFVEVLQGDTDLERALKMAPLAEQRYVAETINTYWRSQVFDDERPQSSELSEEDALRSELVAAKITYEMLKLRGYHRQPTILDLFRTLR